MGRGTIMTDRTYNLPKAVYYQCIWTVKDMDRLRRLELAANTGCRENEIVFFEVDEEAVSNREVLKQARFKMGCIRMALNEVPEEYRRNTIDSIIYSIPFSEMAHENTWRKWRKVFIRKLASNLLLI